MSMRGRFVWEDLMTTDLKSAAAFYGRVAGLTTAPAASAPSYTTFEGSGSGMGGLMALDDKARATGVPPHWLSYVGTDNVDATVRQAQSLGGTVVHAPEEIPSVGRFGVLRDPQGAVFALFSTTRPFPLAAPPPPGHMSWHELATTDIDAAMAFYQSLFGWHVTQDMHMGATGTYRLFAPEGSTDAFGGMYTRAAEQPGPVAWLPYIKVADGKAASATAKSLGARILHGPADVPGGGLITMAIDPQGAAFALHQAGPVAPPKRAAATRGTKPPQKTKPPRKTKKPRKKTAARKVAKPKRKAARKKAGSKK